MKKLRIALASDNPKKKLELCNLLQPEFDILSLDELKITELPEESGSTFIENALIKAFYVYEETGLATIGDDSGLLVDALEGQPGVRSKRWLEGSDKDRNIGLIERLKHVSDANRTARFETSIAFVTNQKTLIGVGQLNGFIQRKPLGENGFGYDPIFVPQNEIRTLAQMSFEEKNQISHRRRAVLALLTVLKL